MGWWTKWRRWIGLAVAAVLTIATLGLTSPLLVGEAVLTAGLTAFGATAAEAGALASTVIIGSTTVASVVGGAIIGAAGGAVSSAIGGTNVLKGALTGLVGGAVGPLVSGGTSALLGNLGIPSTAASIISRGVGGFGAGTAGGFAAGMSPSQALRAGALGGGAGLISGAAEQAFGLDKPTTSAVSSLSRAGLGLLFPSSTQKKSAPASSVTPTVTQGTGRTYAPTLSQYSPPSRQSAGAALGLSPSVSYIGGPVFGSSGTEKPRRKVWNVASLRNVGD